jgi:hypothetical protein
LSDGAVWWLFGLRSSEGKIMKTILIDDKFLIHDFICNSWWEICDGRVVKSLRSNRCFVLNILCKSGFESLEKLFVGFVLWILFFFKIVQFVRSKFYQIPGKIQHLQNQNSHTFFSRIFFMILWRNVCNLCLNSHGVQGLPNSFDSNAVDFFFE